MPDIHTNGACFTATKRNMVTGMRGNRLSHEAAESVIRQSTDFLQRVVDIYERDVARAEVGEGGSGRVGHEAVERECPTVLLYGRVQSGKTAAMVMTTALAMDNGFHIVIVLTANNVTLVRQTTNRFKALDGPTVLSTFKADAEYEWDGILDQIRESLGTDGLVIVSGKDPTHLAALIGLLQELDAAEYPALIFDDEADAATPDTTLAARTSGRTNAPSHASTINRRVVENTAPGQTGESIREVLPHNVYVQVTATPFVLLLQRLDSPVRPSLTHLLEPGEGYCGGEAFFGAFDITQPMPAPPIVLVANTEAQSLLVARRAGTPAGMSRSVAFFLIAGAAHASVRHGGSYPPQGYKHLSHTSVRMDQHDHLVNVIQRHLHDLRPLIRDPVSGPTRQYFQSAYDELLRNRAELEEHWHRIPPMDELLSLMAQNFGQFEVIKVNASTGVPEYGPRYNFVVGGNILGRGITIDDLLVTYYLREAQTSQMDTVWQHGRMFGYRHELMPFTRIYLPGRLARLFQGIHESEVDLRRIAEGIAQGGAVPISVLQGTRATRPNALEASAIRIYQPGSQIFPRYSVSDPAAVGNSNSEIRNVLIEANVPLNEPARERRFRDASTDTLVQLAKMVPIREEDDGRWDIEAVAAVLTGLSARYRNIGSLYVRAFDRGEDRRFQTGVLSGPEVDIARRQAKPVLALVYNGEHDNPQYWYPTLYLPTDAPIQVFNADN
ncbi:MAG: Z1 domain-containing protein [Pseudomonadota bacterium]